ncbi:MAG: phosphoserine phosphatase RsbU/P [Abditibacteriota bacterium]|nr:phosphoserine phosphatase RsbU/P [Abditibacteriota bacterium]
MSIFSRIAGGQRASLDSTDRDSSTRDSASRHASQKERESLAQQRVTEKRNAERRRAERRNRVAGSVPRRMLWDFDEALNRIAAMRFPRTSARGHDNASPSDVAQASAEQLEERRREAREAELIVAVFRTIVLLLALLGPRVFRSANPASSLEEGARSLIWLAAAATIYNILTGLGCLLPTRYGLRRPFIVTMDMLLITLWIQLSGQWELRPFYYIVVVVAAMWFRVFGGLLAAVFCNFFFLYVWLRSASGPMLNTSFESAFGMRGAGGLIPVFTAAMAINTAMLFLVGCLVGYIAEAQERERERRLEDQLLIANYQREIDLSTQLQPALMATQLLGIEAPLTSVVGTSAGQSSDLQIGAAMKSARQLGGGDYFDLIPLPEGRTGLCIADVSGKSVRAQARLPLLKYSLRALAPLYAQPDRLLERLNETLAPDLQPELYIALCYIVLDPRRRTLTWCNAGHIAPLLLSPTADESERAHNALLQSTSDEPKILENMSLVALDTDGPAIGMFPELTYEARTLPWLPGDQLLLFTDGLTDALSFRGSEDGEEQTRKFAQRLLREVEREPREVAQELVDLAVAVLDESTPLERAQSVLLQTPFKYDEAEDAIDAKHRDDIMVIIARHSGAA